MDVKDTAFYSKSGWDQNFYRLAPLSSSDGSYRQPGAQILFAFFRIALQEGRGKRKPEEALFVDNETVGR